MALQAKPIKRLYNMEDELMLTRAQTMHDNLLNDLADFTAKFPWVDVVLVTSFQSDINTALSYAPDAASVNNIKVLTEDLDTSVGEGMKALDALDIYARVAFPDSPAKQRVFGQDNWDKARTDQQKMSKALKLANSFADNATYKPALLAKGMVQADIDNLLTVAANIDLKDKLQEFAISGRPISTEDRIKVHNIVWERQQTISTCSELVYRDDAAKLEQYQLYPSTTSSNTTVVRDGNLNMGQVANIDLTGINGTGNTIVSIQVGNSPIRIYSSASPGGGQTGGSFDVQAGQTVEFTGTQFGQNLNLNDQNKFINAQNIGAQPGSYKITFSNL